MSLERSIFARLTICWPKSTPINMLITGQSSSGWFIHTIYESWHVRAEADPAGGRNVAGK